MATSSIGTTRPTDEGKRFIVYEPHLLQTKEYNDFLERLAKLSPSSQAQWGKMNVAQMLAHVAAALEMGMTDKKVTQMLLGRIFGPFGKREILTTGIPKNSPTVPSIKISDQRQFQGEKERLQRGLERFFKEGETGITEQPHEFWGRLTSNEWARLQYVHLDHHLKQFGV
jgi:Protein of unknown function (DUF1569)